tara:strand:+ start:508 stop:720 length:213 start_codon:yes stop_codon:yes gene_type:complete
MSERINQNWKKWIKYPYKGHVLSNPQYIKDKDELFAKHGNGWWWGPGWWSDKKFETPMVYHRRKRKEREK